MDKIFNLSFKKFLARIVKFLGFTSKNYAKDCN